MTLSEYLSTRPHDTTIYRYVGTIWGDDDTAQTGAEWANTIAQLVEAGCEADGEIVDHPANGGGDGYYVQSQGVWNHDSQGGQEQVLEVAQSRVKGCIHCAFGQWPRSERCNDGCDNHGPDKYAGVHGPNAYVTCPNCGSRDTGWGRTPDEAHCMDCGCSLRYDSAREEWV